MHVLPAALRKLALDLEKDTHGLSKGYTNAILDAANAVEVLEGNIVYLTSCMAATADELNERKSTPSHQITRQYNLMEVCARVLAGIPAWRNSSESKISLARVERAREEIATRLRNAKKPR